MKGNISTNWNGFRGGPVTHSALTQSCCGLINMLEYLGIPSAAFDIDECIDYDDISEFVTRVKEI